ncbi:16184_t:CDS:2 [Rhizophagus irregularis]|nr:16184_t:CDS:2 [Rhizophagus irregularis]
MTRGYSLEQDLRLLINNPKVILAARSEVFDRLLYNGMKESYENQISFPKINSAGMEIVLEYTYTGSINEESLTRDNIIEALYAADFFQLPELQDFIMKTIKNSNLAKNYSPELLSKAVETRSLSENDTFIHLLVEIVATIPLNTIEFNRLSIAAFQYLLFCTHEKEIQFATPEYEVFRYCAILAAKQVSNNAYETLMKWLPTLEQIENSAHKIDNMIFITDHQKVAKELKSLIKFIDFRLIKTHILANFIEPLGIVPTELILSVYRHKALLNNSDLNDARGIPFYRWDELAHGSKLIIEDNEKVVRVLDQFNSQSVRARMILENKNIFEWDVIVEKSCNYIWVGVCSSENFSYESWAGKQPTGWVLGSSGNCYNSDKRSSGYCPSFGDGTEITVHLNMNKRTCAFTVNGTKYPEVSEWNNLPSKLYPVVSLKFPGRLRIQSHQKI